jgi:hypothetical protein
MRQTMDDSIENAGDHQRSVKLEASAMGRARSRAIMNVSCHRALAWFSTIKAKVLDESSRTASASTTISSPGPGMAVPRQRLNQNRENNPMQSRVDRALAAVRSGQEKNRSST